MEQDSRTKHTSLAVVLKMEDSITLIALLLRGLEPIPFNSKSLKYKKYKKNVSWKSVVLNTNREEGQYKILTPDISHGWQNYIFFSSE